MRAYDLQIGNLFFMTLPFSHYGQTKPYKVSMIYYNLLDESCEIHVHYENDEQRTRIIKFPPELKVYRVERYQKHVQYDY